MSQVVLLWSEYFHASSFFIYLSVLEKLNKADSSFCSFSRTQMCFKTKISLKDFFLQLKWDMGCEGVAACVSTISVWSGHHGTHWLLPTCPQPLLILHPERIYLVILAAQIFRRRTSNSSHTHDNKLWLETQIEGCSEHAHTQKRTHTLCRALICGIDRVHCFHRACHYMPCNVIKARRFMLLCSSPEPDPCCVWSWAEKPSLCPAAPDFCSGLCHCVGLQCCSLLNWKLWFIVALVFVLHVEGTLGLSLLFPCKFVANSKGTKLCLFPCQGNDMHERVALV